MAMKRAVPNGYKPLISPIGNALDMAMHIVYDLILSFRYYLAPLVLQSVIQTSYKLCL